MIPDFQSIMLPLLKIAGDKKEHTLQEIRESLADYFQLTDEDKSKLLSKTRHPVFGNRVGWARTYLKKVGLLEYTSKEEGREGHVLNYNFYLIFQELTPKTKRNTFC